MPTPVSAGTIWLFTIEQRLAGQVVLNTLHLRRQGSADTPDYQAAANTFLNYQASNVAGLLSTMAFTQSNQLTYARLIMQPIYPIRYRRVIRDTPGSAGTLSEEAMPPNVQARLTKRGVPAQRWAVGGMDLSGAPATEGDRGYWEDDQMDRFRNVCNLLEAPLEAGDASFPYDLVLWSPSVPGRVTPVQTVDTEPTIRTQRRRTVGRGI